MLELDYEFLQDDDDDPTQCSEDLIDSLLDLNNDIERRRFLLVRPFFSSFTVI